MERQQLPCEVIPALDVLGVALPSHNGHMRLTHHRLVGSPLLPLLVNEAGVADLVHIQGQRQRNCIPKLRQGRRGYLVCGGGGWVCGLPGRALSVRGRGWEGGGSLGP